MSPAFGLRKGNSLCGWVRPVPPTAPIAVAALAADSEMEGLRKTGKEMEELIFS